MSSTQEVGEIFGYGEGPAQAMLRSPTVLIVSVGLWGMNIFFFRLFRLNYRYILNYDLAMEKELIKPEPPVKSLDGSGTPSSNTSTDDEWDDDGGEDGHVHPEAKAGSIISWQRLVSLSLVLVIMLHTTTFVWVDVLGRSSIGAVFGFYAVVMAYIFMPIHSNRWLRKAFVIVLQRSFELINPRCSCIFTDANGPRPIPFIDVFFADAMCSLSKVFFDWGLLIHMASHYPRRVPPSMHNIIIPSACAAVPYVIRARQCLIMHTVGRIKNDPKRYQHLLNAIKYSTSIFPLCLSAYQKVIGEERGKELELLMLAFLTINALYALYWDIVMDWGMMQNPAAAVSSACVSSSGLPSDALPPPSCRGVVLRNRLRFGVFMSSVIMLTDAVLRFSWMLRFVQKTLFPSTDNFILCTQFLEVFRRAIWNLLRVEWENIKQKAKKDKARHPSAHADIGDDETSPFIATVAMAPIAPPPSTNGSNLQTRK